MRLQLARFAINCGDFDASLAIAHRLLLDKKDNPSASGLLILSLTRLGRYSDLFDYLETASARALSPDWAVLAFVHEYEASSKIDPSRMIRVIEKNCACAHRCLTPLVHSSEANGGFCE